ncbi:MAG: hypothetical protein Kow0098_06680 [Ignavibacteriaceae bacterium]
MYFNRKVDIPGLILFVVMIQIILPGCRPGNVSPTGDESVARAEFTFYKQADMDYARRLIMLSATEGYAISQGRGDVDGHVYKFDHGSWQQLYSFPYSDYPFICLYDSSVLWSVNHLTHDGFYKPELKEFRNNISEEIILPKVMWDETDYVMFKDGEVLPDGSAWFVGQQGRIIRFDGERWFLFPSPVNKDSLPTLLSGDLNDIEMIDSSEGWAVGKDGLIIQYRKGRWKKFDSPTSNTLNSLWMPDKNTGWAVGQKGTLLKFENNIWEAQTIETSENLTAIDGTGINFVVVAGANSTLFTFNGSEWLIQSNAKDINDSFLDVEVLEDSLYGKLIWIGGNNGIYTNSQTIGFSFSNYTRLANIRPTGRGAVFFNQQSEFTPDMLVINHGGPPLLYLNNGAGQFTESSALQAAGVPLNETNATAVADVNNDGRADLLQIYYGDKFRFYLANGNQFIDFSNRSNLHFTHVEPASRVSAGFADFNNDAALDLIVTNYEDEILLFSNCGTGRFRRITAGTGLPLNAKYPVSGALLSDFNNDNLTDIFLLFRTATDSQFCKLFINKGNFSFSEARNAGLPDAPTTRATFASAISEDFNNDGLKDILLYNENKLPVLLLNNGNVTFRNAGREAGFTKPLSHPEPTNGVLNAADVNNDGFIDVFISSRLYLNSSATVFTEVSEQTGIDATGDPSFADIDNDGDMDLFIGNSSGAGTEGDKAVLYRNNLNNNNFLKVRLSGDRSNRNCFGAKVFVESFDSSGKKIYTQLREKGIGSAPMIQQNIDEIHFGLNAALKHKLRIIFPDGNEKVIDNVQPGKVMDIYQSGFPARQITLILNSINRSLLLFEWGRELLKFAGAVFTLLLLIFYAASTGAGKTVKNIYFPAVFIVIYLVISHFTIMESFIHSALVSVFVLIPFSLAYIYFYSDYLKKKEAAYISHYRLYDVLGEGGMGKVYKAADVNTKDVVALKVLHPVLLEDPENRKRFISEGQILSAFNHPFIVKVIETGESGSLGFIAMEFLEGGTLKEYLNRNYPLQLEEIKRIFIQICDGLTEIHSKNIVHRDLKTNNIMFDAECNVRIMDFGLSKSGLVTTMTSLGTAVGTLGYVAPELITNVLSDKRSDIFSLGVMLYEAATNELPFKGENEIALIHSIFNTNPVLPSEKNSLYPEKLDRIIERCLRKIPDERYSDAEGVKEELNSLN